MKRMVMLATACLLGVFVGAGAFAEMEKDMSKEWLRPQGPPHVRGEQGVKKGRMHRGGREEAFLARIVSNPKIAEKIGLTEQQVKTLKDTMYDMQVEQKKLQLDKELAAMEQARLMTESTVDEKAVLAAVEKIGKISTEIAKLRVKHLLLVKKTLTPEQIENVKELIHKQMKERHRHMRERLHKRRQEDGEGSRWKPRRERRKREDRERDEMRERDDRERDD